MKRKKGSESTLTLIFLLTNSESSTTTAFAMLTGDRAPEWLKAIGGNIWDSLCRFEPQTDPNSDDEAVVAKINNLQTYQTDLLMQSCRTNKVSGLFCSTSFILTNEWDWFICNIWNLHCLNPTLSLLSGFQIGNMQPWCRLTFVICFVLLYIKTILAHWKRSWENPPQGPLSGCSAALSYHMIFISKWWRFQGHDRPHFLG